MSKIIYWASYKKHYSEIYSMADINAVEFFYRNEFVLKDLADFNKNRKQKLQYFDYAMLMHKRLINYDEHRLDKWKIINLDEYKPVTEVAKKT